eukprot:5980260-Prymnesium_polylepis.1
MSGWDFLEGKNKRIAYRCAPAPSPEACRAQRPSRRRSAWAQRVHDKSLARERVVNGSKLEGAGKARRASTTRTRRLSLKRIRVSAKTPCQRKVKVIEKLDDCATPIPHERENVR